jgi:hypothetical protein
MLHACFYTICLMFRYTSWHFYAFSETNLLTSRHSASSLFSAVFCVSEVIHRKYSRNWTKQVPEVLFCPGASRDPKRSRSGATRGPHARLAWPRPWPRRPGVRPPGSTPDDAPSPIKTPRREKPKYPDQFSRNISRSTAVVDPRSGGSRSSSRHPAGEGNRHRRSSSSPCLPPER